MVDRASLLQALMQSGQVLPSSVLPMSAMLTTPPPTAPHMAHVPATPMAPTAVAQPFNGQLHVIASHDPDEGDGGGRTKIHGVFANQRDAAEAHKMLVRKAYADFLGDEGSRERRTTHALAIKRMIDANYPMPSVSNVWVGGKEAPDSIAFDLSEPENAPSHIQDELQQRWKAYMDRPEPFPGLRKANQLQKDYEHISRGEDRTGIIKVTKHPVISSVPEGQVLP